jgi:hypothetical protein
MTVICHSKRLESSTRPAEKPSTGFLARSVFWARVGFVGWGLMSGRPSVSLQTTTMSGGGGGGGGAAARKRLLTPQLLLQQQGRVIRHLAVAAPRSCAG